MKKAFFLNLTLILLFAIASCSDKNDEQKSDEITLTFWHSFIASTIPALDTLIADFESTHPGIKIKPQYIPTGDALIQKLITAIQSNTAPDISWLHADYMEDLVEADAIYKMEHFINGENGLSETELSEIYPSLLQYASWRGTLYSLPMEATNLAIVYNKDMFKKYGLDPERPPQTWNELKEYVKKLTIDEDKDGNYEQVGFFIPNYPASGPWGNYMVWQFMPYLWQAGGYLITAEQDRVLFNEKPGVEALSLWKELYQAQSMNTFTNDYDIAFASQRLAMAMDGPWNLPRYEEIVKDFDYGFAFLPAGPAKRATVVGGEYLAIFKQSKNPEAAWSFIKWMISQETQAKWAMTSGYLPIRHDVISVPEFSDYLNKHPHFRVFFEQMDYSQAQRPIDYGSLQIIRYIGEAIEKSMLGDLPPEEMLNEAAKKSNQILEQKRKIN